MAHARLAESDEYVTVDLAADVIITSDPVQIALRPRGERPPAWPSAEWLDAEHVTGGARVRPSPPPAVGIYHVYVRIDDNPETPVLDAGYLTVT